MLENFCTIDSVTEELGRVIEVKLEQLENAYSPIEVRESGSMIEFKLEQREKA